MSPIVTVPQETNSNSVLHIAENAGDSGISSMPRLKQVVKGVKATQAKEGKKGKSQTLNHARATTENEASFESRHW